MPKSTMLRAVTVLVGMPCFALAGLGAFGACSSPLTPDAKMTSDDVTRAWVASHRGSLPTAFEGISDQPNERRKPIYAGLTPDQKLALWRTQVESFVRSPSELSPMQKATASSLRDPLTEVQKRAVRAALDSLPRIFDESIPIEQRRALANRLCSYNRGTFTRAQAAAIFGSIGPSGQTGSTATATRQGARPTVVQSTLLPTRALLALSDGLAKVSSKFGVRFRLVQSGLYTCNCNSNSFCGCSTCSGSDKNTGVTTCTYLYPDYVECGCFWYFTCDGLCE